VVRRHWPLVAHRHVGGRRLPSGAFDLVRSVNLYAICKPAPRKLAISFT
jgi:hypothetical protein